MRALADLWCLAAEAADMYMMCQIRVSEGVKQMSLLVTGSEWRSGDGAE